VNHIVVSIMTYRGAIISNRINNNNSVDWYVSVRKVHFVSR